MERVVAQRSALPEDQGTVVYIDSRSIAVFRAGDDVYVYANSCPHKGGPIGEGLVVDGIVTCPWHGSQFEIATGVCVRGPAPGPLDSVPIDLHGDDIAVDVHP
jgi:nitrite reductase/ring-hydroxylating ferredoxin subunit